MKVDDYISNVITSNSKSTPELVITDINKLVITKIRNNKVYFKYDNVRYFVVAEYDCGDQFYRLYRKIFDDSNNCKVTQIAVSGWTFADISYLLDEKSNRSRNTVYTHIGKVYFLTQLANNNLVNYTK